jgi:hypothetical protein
MDLLFVGVNLQAFLEIILSRAEQESAWGVLPGHAVAIRDVTDWRQWHARYDDPESSLARRLEVVRRHVSEAVSGHRPTTPMRILSLCSGDGRDLLPILARGERLMAHAILVEQDATLAQEARATAVKLGVDHVTVVTGDAGETKSFAFALPVDLLLLCGIFGNVSEEDVALTVAATPAMLRPGGTVIWTRGSTPPDLRSTIRRWFVDAGRRDTAVDSEPNGFGVGVATESQRSTNDPPLPARLFTFVR